MTTTSEPNVPERIFIDKLDYNLKKALERGGGNYYLKGDSHTIPYVRASDGDVQALWDASPNRDFSGKKCTECGFDNRFHAWDCFYLSPGLRISAEAFDAVFNEKEMAIKAVTDVYDKAIRIVMDAAENYRKEFKPDGSSFSVMKREVCFAILHKLQSAKAKGLPQKVAVSEDEITAAFHHGVDAAKEAIRSEHVRDRFVHLKPCFINAIDRKCGGDRGPVVSDIPRIARECVEKLMPYFTNDMGAADSIGLEATTVPDLVSIIASVLTQPENQSQSIQGDAETASSRSTVDGFPED